MQSRSSSSDGKALAGSDRRLVAGVAVCLYAAYMTGRHQRCKDIHHMYHTSQNICFFSSKIYVYQPRSQYKNWISRMAKHVIFIFYLAKLAIQNIVMKCPARAKETATKTIAGR